MLQRAAIWISRLESVGPERRPAREEDLEGHRAIVPEVVGEVDRGHPAPPEFALEAVAVSRATTELEGKVGHSRFRPGKQVG